MTNDHQHTGQVGCIDGRVLDVSRYADGVLLEIGDTKIHLSGEAASRLASLLTSDHSGTTDLSPATQQTPPDPVPIVAPSEFEHVPSDSETVQQEFPSSDDKRTEKAGAIETGNERTPRRSAIHLMIHGRRVRIGDLLEAGLLQEGEQLTWMQRKSGPMHLARVLKTGQIELDDGSGRIFNHPSPAAKTASGNIASAGWDVWRAEDGRTLADLRSELINRLS